MLRRSTARAASETPDADVESGNVRLGRIIQSYVDQRNRIGDLDPMELPIVVACRDLIANTVAQLPLVNYRANLPTDVQPPVVVRPDPSEPRWQTFHRLVYNLTGAGYAWVFPTVYDQSSGWPSAVRVVDAGDAAGVFDTVGRLERVVWNGERYDPAAGEVLLVPWRVPRAGTCGQAPLDGCRRAVEYLAALWQMAGSYWEAGYPSLALVVAQALTTTQKQEAKAGLTAAFARSHEPTVVDRGGELVPIGSNAVDAELVASIATANAEIARAFGVMPSLVNVQAGDSLTYATTEAEMSKWLKVGLGAVLSRIEAAWSDLRPYGQSCRFDTGMLLRTDLAARYSAYSVAIGRWLTAAEVRASESLPPMPDATFDASGDSAPSPFSDPVPTVGAP